MNRAPLLLPLLALAVAATAPAAASAAPSVSGAEDALIKKVEKEHRNSFGNGEYVVPACKKKKTTRSEVRYRCDWAIAGDGRYSDWTKGNAWVYGTRNGRTRWTVVTY